MWVYVNYVSVSFCEGVFLVLNRSCDQDYCVTKYVSKRRKWKWRKFLTWICVMKIFLQTALIWQILNFSFSGKCTLVMIHTLFSNRPVLMLSNITVKIPKVLKPMQQTVQNSSVQNSQLGKKIVNIFLNSSLVCLVCHMQLSEWK